MEVENAAVLGCSLGGQSAMGVRAGRKLLVGDESRCDR